MGVKKRKGATLIELIIAVVYMGITLPVLLYCIATILENAFFKSEGDIKTVMLAQSRMEQVVVDFAAKGFDGLIADTVDIYDPDDYAPGVVQSGEASPQYAIETTVQPIAGSDLNIAVRSAVDQGSGPPSPPLAGFNPDLRFKRVTVSVYKVKDENARDLMTQLYLVVNSMYNTKEWWKQEEV